MEHHHLSELPDDGEHRQARVLNLRQLQPVLLLCGLLVEEPGTLKRPSREGGGGGSVRCGGEDTRRCLTRYVCSLPSMVGVEPRLHETRATPDYPCNDFRWALLIQHSLSLPQNTRCLVVYQYIHREKISAGRRGWGKGGAS